MSTLRLWERRLGFDETGHEQREACLAITTCPVCGEEIELIAETEAWTERDGRWHHLDYSPACAEHCGKLIADWYEGCFVFDLDGPHS